MEIRREAPPRNMQPFEIEVASKAQSRDIELWPRSVRDDAKPPSGQRWGPRRRRCPHRERLRELQRQFEIDLAEARLEDTQDLDILDFVRLGNCDREGREALLFIAKHVPNDVIRQERTQRFFLQKLETVGQKPFSLVYIHTGSNLWNSQVGLRVTWHLFSRIPQAYRERLHKIYVVHPDIYLHIAMWVFVRWFMHSLWEKVTYVGRLEDLCQLFPKVVPQLPSFVKEHDAELAEHPLMDYGFCTLSEVDTSSTYSSGPAFYT